MKHIIMSVAMMAAVAFASSAETFTSGGLSYESIDATTCKVTSGPGGEVTIPETVSYNGVTYTVTQIAPEAWNGSTLTKLVMGNTITEIGKNAMRDNKSLSEVVFSNKLEIIGQEAFEYCTALKEINLPASLRNIVGYTFYGSGVVNVVVPEGVTRIGSYSFCNCKSMTSISFPSTLTTYGSGVLTGCESLSEIKVAEGCAALGSYDGLLYDKNLTTLKLCPVAREGEVTLASTCTMTDSYAFNDCVKVTKINCPNGMLRFDWATFKDCTALTEINMGNSLTYVGRECFNNCSAMTQLNLPETVTTVYDYSCFAGMTSLEELILPEAVTGELGENLFAGDKSLKKLQLGSKIVSFRKNCFTGLESLDTLICNAVTPYPIKMYDSASGGYVDGGTPGFTDANYENTVLIVPSEGLAAYMSTAPWKNFKNIKTNAAAVGANAATILSMVNPERIPWSELVTLTFKVQNQGTNAINSITGTLTIDGDAYPSQTFEGLNIPAGATVDVDVPLPLNIAKYEMTLSLDKINGQDNESPNKVFSFTLETVDASMPENAPEATYAKFKDTGYVGWNQAKHLDAAIKFVDPALVGAKVIGAKVIGLYPSGIKNVKLWSSNTLTTSDFKEINPVEINDQQTCMTKFYDPITLTAQGAYFGISLDTDPDDPDYWPFPYSAPANVPGGFMESADGGSYEDVSEYGALQMILILDPDSYPANGLKPVGTNAITAFAKGNSFKLPFEVVNYTGKEIANINYSYTGDGKTHQGTITETIPAFATVSNTITVPIDAIEEPGNYDLVLSLDQVNGAANAWDNKTLTVPFSVGQFETDHRPIMEEMTGTGCGYCPRGMLGLAEMAKTYPEFIGAAYHRYNTSDPMRCTSSGPFSSNGAPNSILDRSLFDVDPFFGTNGESMGIAADYEAQRNILAPANIGIKTQWNADSTQITANVDGEFSYVGANESYKIGYLLTIDGVHGDGAAWKQVNYYEGGSNSNPLIQTLCDGSFDLKVFNHVVIDNTAWKGVYNIPSPAAGSTFETSRVFGIANLTLTDPSWITDPENCSLKNINVVVMLIDNQGRVRNARQVRAGQNADIPTGINRIEANDNDQDAVYYDLMGRRILNPNNGIYVKVQGSKATKVLVND